MQIDKYAVISRVLAFLAVSCSIAAVAMTIREPILLAIGIPGLAAGHFYSWRRRNSSIRRSLILLLFAIITVFLGGEILLSGFSDRLLLSRYLIYGLVIGSFDLMRRRNIVASLILGGLLLVLISEFALSLWFLVFIIVFTVLALIAATVNRLETETSRTTQVGELRWLTAGKIWLGLAVGTLLLSAVFFLMMPRLASNAVVQANWLPSRLDLSLGGPAMLPSRPSASLSPGILPSRQEGGVFGDEQYATLGYVGSLADRAVIQVRSRISSYWRGATLDQYDGQGWLPSSLQLKLRDENRREYVLPDSKLNLSGGKVYWQAYYILSDQPNAVFTGYNPGRIYLPGTDPIFLERGTLYRALSIVPQLRPELLRNDNAISEDISNLMLPPISERTAALAESIVQGASTDYDRAARLERFLLINYPYELDVEPVPLGRDAVDYFLFEQQAGYCSSFATSMAVMARHVGLPARVAIGYLPGFIDPITGAHVVRVGDAHAWVEIHFWRHGWVAFDPTPRPDAAMGFAVGRNSVYFALEDLTGITFAGILSPLTSSLSFGPLSIPIWVWIVLLGGGITITVLALLLTRHGTRTKQEIIGYSVLLGEERRLMLNLYRKMIVLLIKRGLPSRHLYQPPYEYAAIICSQIPDIREQVEWLSQAASSAAYDPNPFKQSLVSEARQRLSVLRQILKKRHTG